MNSLKQGDTCMVVRNTTGDECRAAAVGRFVIKVQQSGIATLSVRVGAIDGLWRGVVWDYEGPVLRCPLTGQQCEAMRVFPHADLQRLPEQQDVREHDEQMERLDSAARKEPQPAWRTDS